MNRKFAEEAVKAALSGDKERLKYFMDRIDDPEGFQVIMFLGDCQPDTCDTINFRGKEMTQAEYKEMQELDAKMGYPWIHTTLDIK